MKRVQVQSTKNFKTSCITYSTNFIGVYSIHSFFIYKNAFFCSWGWTETECSYFLHVLSLKRSWHVSKHQWKKNRSAAERKRERGERWEEGKAFPAFPASFNFSPFPSFRAFLPSATVGGLRGEVTWYRISENWYKHDQETLKRPLCAVLCQRWFNRNKCCYY